MYNNRERYNKEREVRWKMARDGEQPAIEALVRKMNKRFSDNIIPVRYDNIWFERYDPKHIEWVKGCSDYYLCISSSENNNIYMYTEVKIKNTCFDATIKGGTRSGQQVSNYGCASFYLDIVPVYSNMNQFCEIANIDKNNFLIMFTDSSFNSIRLISLLEINSLLQNGWNGVRISEFGAGYGSRSYLIPIDATHKVEDLTVNQIRNYSANALSLPTSNMIKEQII